MSRPKGSKNKQSASSPQNEILEITCLYCGKSKKIREYYVSYNPAHKIGRIPYCKKCLKKMIADDFGKVQLEKLKKTLKLIDRPFLYNIWRSSLEEKGDTFGLYMKNMAIKQNRELTWEDSKFLPEVEGEINYENVNMEQLAKKQRFIITDNIIEKWGSGYKPEEYEAFERKYALLKNNYPEKTAMHTEALLNYIRYRVKEEIATALGDVKDAKDWGALAKDAATAAKINPSQLSKADLTDGLSTFSELVRATEQAVDIIHILPKFKQKPQDSVDFNIWCYINYIRDLKGLPLCTYEDIYQFYEERKREYKEMYQDTNIFGDVEDGGDE